MAIRVTRYESAEGLSRAMDVRGENDRIGERAEQFRFVSRVPMLCECSAPSCRTLVMVSLAEYKEIREQADSFLTAPAHEVEGTESATETPEYAVRVRRRCA